MVQDSHTSGIQDALFHEIHHRFYNSLQLISASARQLSDCEIVPASLLDLQDRIAMLADLHRLLSDPVSYDRCTAATLADICDSLARMFGRDDTIFVIDLQALPAEPIAARAILLAIVELVTNALKHAQPSTPLRIAIAAARDETGFRLSAISNTARGGRASVTRPHVVSRLVAALSGEMAVRCDKDFAVEIRLPPPSADRGPPAQKAQPSF